MLGFLLTNDPQAQPPWRALGLLLASSSLLYTAGMVLNDVFDAAEDAKERPERPIPSGRVSLSLARLVGFEMLVLGAALGWATSYFYGRLRSGLLASLLAGAVVLYDGVLKRTPLGPLGIGACRMLNVLLGMSLLRFNLELVHYVIAGGIGLYVTGITWFARREAAISQPWHLALATGVMAAGIGALASFPSLAAGSSLRIVAAFFPRWYLLLGLVGALILWRCLRAILDPRPPMVKIAVKQALISLIVLDAVACVAVRGWPPAMMILVLVVPALVLGRWFYST